MKPKDWFIGDTHFGHANLLTFDNNTRVFESIDEHDEAIVDNWNSVVDDDDRVFHLGDVAFASKYHYLKRLNGRKIVVVLGNHDYYSKIKDIIEDERFVVCGSFVYRREYLLTHIPAHPCQLEHRFKGNIHGHMHTHTIPDRRYVNVSCEQVNMTPIDFEEVKRRME